MWPMSPDLWSLINPDYIDSSLFHRESLLIIQWECWAKVKMLETLDPDLSLKKYWKSRLFTRPRKSGLKPSGGNSSRSTARGHRTSWRRTYSYIDEPKVQILSKHFSVALVILFFLIKMSPSLKILKKYFFQFSLFYNFLKWSAKTTKLSNQIKEVYSSPTSLIPNSKIILNSILKESFHKIFMWNFYVNSENFMSMWNFRSRQNHD